MRGINSFARLQSFGYYWPLILPVQDILYVSRIEAPHMISILLEKAI